jgi:HD-like signal output (HDOD) protein
VATHIIELAQDPDIEMGEVVKALSMDSALSTKVLRWCCRRPMPRRRAAFANAS